MSPMKAWRVRRKRGDSSISSVLAVIVPYGILCFDSRVTLAHDCYFGILYTVHPGTIRELAIRAIDQGDPLIVRFASIHE